MSLVYAQSLRTRYSIPTLQDVVTYCKYGNIANQLLRDLMLEIKKLPPSERVVGMDAEWNMWSDKVCLCACMCGLCDCSRVCLLL